MKIVVISVIGELFIIISPDVKINTLSLSYSNSVPSKVHAARCDVCYIKDECICVRNVLNSPVFIFSV